MHPYRVVLIILYDSQKRFLLQCRTDDAKMLPGHWAFFGGGIKEGESLLDALKREALEEINYRVENPVLIWEQDFTESNIAGHLYIFIEHFKEDKSGLRLGEGKDWGWFDKSEVNDLKMIGRDREIVRFIARKIENAANQ